MLEELDRPQKIALGVGFGLGLAAVGGAALYALAKVGLPPPTEVASFAGFAEEILQGPPQTTYRQRDGASGYDFRYYPLVRIMPDINGMFSVLWGWRNFLDGAAGGNSGGQIIENLFAMTGGVEEIVQLTDTRAGNVRGGSIAYGDPEGIFDNLWHTFQSFLTITVTSPSAASITLTEMQGARLDEQFRSVGPLAVSFAGFNEIIVP